MDDLDLDREWKPSRRPQSTIALNFMSELDDLFKLDGGLDLLDKTVHQKKQAVTTHTQELEALEARLRETEERLKNAKSSPPSRKASQRQTPSSNADKAPSGEASSPSAVRQKPRVDPRAPKAIADRPRTARTDDEESA